LRSLSLSPFPSLAPHAAVTSEPFEVSDDADAVQMLTRSTQCGEFYLMTPPMTMGGSDGAGWRPHMCDMIIYDEEADKHVRIAWEEALAATMVAQTGEIAGSTVNPANGEVAGETGAGSSMADWYARAAAWAKWNVEPAAGGNKKNEFDAYRAEKIPYIVVARPFSAPPPAPARTPPAPRSRVRPCAPQSST